MTSKNQPVIAGVVCPNESKICPETNNSERESIKRKKKPLTLRNDDERRREQGRIRMKRYFQKETPEKKAKRLAKNREYKRKLRMNKTSMFFLKYLNHLIFRRWS